MIRLEDISKTFNDGDTTIEAVKPCSITFDKGSFIALIGPSGSGKSTLLTIMGALQTPTTGLLEIDGMNVYEQSDKTVSDIRFKKIGFILQGSNLVPYLTIKEQFQMKLKVAKKQDVYDMNTLFSMLDIEHIQDKYPDQISGGERQRAAIGLSLYLKPDIILADEPTASLDTKRAHDVVGLLKEISVDLKTTVVMVTHDIRMLETCDAVYEMNDGTLSRQR